MKNQIKIKILDMTNTIMKIKLTRSVQWQNGYDRGRFSKLKNKAVEILQHEYQTGKR